MPVRGGQVRGVAVRAHVGVGVRVSWGPGTATAKAVPDECGEDAESEDAEGDGEAEG